jgi:hypothetical protein
MELKPVWLKPFGAKVDALGGQAVALVLWHNALRT